jgi:hypothetical protein
MLIALIISVGVLPTTQSSKLVGGPVPEVSKIGSQACKNPKTRSPPGLCIFVYIKRFRDQVNLSEPLYQITQDLPVQFNSICGSPKHRDIYDYKFSFLETAYIVYLCLMSHAFFVDINI